MTRLNSAVTPESIQSMKIGGEMNLAQQKLNQEAADRAQRGQIARQRMQVEREGQKQRNISDQLNRRMERDIAYDRMAQAAYDAEENRRIRVESDKLSRELSQKQFEEEKRQYDLDRQLQIKQYEKVQRLEELKIEKELSIAEKGLEASQEEMKILTELEKEISQHQSNLVRAHADIQGKSEDFRRFLPQHLKNIGDEVSGLTEFSDPALSRIAGNMDGDNHYLHPRTYGGQEAPIRGAIADSGITNPYGLFGLVGAFTGALDSRDTAILGAIGEDTPATGLIDHDTDGTGGFTPYNTQRIDDLGVRLEQDYAREIASGLITADPEKAALFSQDIARAFRRASEFSNKTRKERARALPEIMGELNNAAAAYGINPAVLGNVLSGVKNDVSARTNEYLKGGWAGMTLEDIEPDVMTTRSGAREGQNMSRQFDHFVGSKWYTQKNVSGILSLGSAATTTDEILVRIDGLQRDDISSENIMDIIGDRGFIDVDGDGIVQPGEGMEEVIAMAEELIAGKDEVKALEETLEEARKKEARGVGRAEVQREAAEQRARIEAIKKLLVDMKATN